VPLASLPDDQWTHEEAAHRLSGRYTRLCFALGQAVEVRLAEIMPLTGGMVFHLLQGSPPSGGARRARARRLPANTAGRGARNASR